MGSDQAIVLNA